jgi:hypothetical protein
MKILILLVTFLGFQSAWSAQDAVIVTDGAMIYRQANFDSAVIGYMRAGQKTKISSKTFGAFYRVRFKQGVVGYISDVDVEPQGGRRGRKPTTPKDRKFSKSFISKRYFGILLSQVHFAETYNDADVGEDMLFYGLKFTMPMKYLLGPFVLDSELLYHSGAPSYYNSSISSAVSGKVLIFDLEAMFSLYESRNRGFWAYVGAGPAFVYSSFVVTLNNSQQDLSEADFGGVITGGVAVRMSKLAFKFEPKYFVFKSSYFGFLGSLQYEF